MIPDLFAGPGGWSEGLRMAGLSDTGIEWDADACRTRAAAGHRTIRADVAQYPTEPFRGRVSGLIASPPCQAFSMAGKGDGRAEIVHIHAAVEACRDGWVEPDREWLDGRTPLILQPLRWVWDLRPEWVACEQVPPAMPVWEHMADVFRSWGYSATAVVLSAEQYGVPQTRKRAFLLAHRTRPVVVPTPTHQRYRPGVAQGVGCGPDLFGPGLLPWVSMAEALGWSGFSAHYKRGSGMTERHGERPDRADVEPAPTLTGSALGAGAGAKMVLRGNQVPPGTDEYHARDAEAPAQTLSGNADSYKWTLRAGTNANDAERESGEPSPTLRFGERLNSVEWANRPYPTLCSGKGNALGGINGSEARDGIRLALQMRGTSNATTRPAPAPAPAVAFGHDAAQVKWVRTSFGEPHRGKEAGSPKPEFDPNEQPCRTVNGKTADWTVERPATSVVGSFRPDIIAAPGYRTEVSRQDAEGSVRIELWEAAVLQGFPPDYPFQGSKTAQFRQVGDAVCPPVAKAIAQALAGGACAMEDAA